MFDFFFIAEVRDLTDFSSLQARRVFAGRDQYATRNAAEQWATLQAQLLEATQRAAGLDIASIEGRAFSCEGEAIA